MVVSMYKKKHIINKYTIHWIDNKVFIDMLSSTVLVLQNALEYDRKLLNQSLISEKSQY